jgi:hypothetical protein
MTMLAWAKAGRDGISSAGFLPCMLNRAGQVYPVDATSAEGKQVTDYVSKGCQTQGLKSSFRIDEDVRFGDLCSVRMEKPL